MRLKDRLLDIILGLSIVLGVLVGYLGYCALFAHMEKAKPADKKVQFEIEYVKRPSDWKEQMRDLYNTPHSVQWKEIKDVSIGGYTNLLTRQVYIRIDLYEPEEVLTYAHELTHLKYFTINDTFVTYQAIVTLYESEIPYFRYVALWNANNIINNYSYSGTRYDCGWLLQQYFDGKEN